VDRRVDVGKIPLIGRELAVRVHVPLAQQQQQLAFGECRIDRRERNHVEGGVPRGKPRVFPFVGHREDVARVKVVPIRVAAPLAGLQRRLAVLA